MERGINMARTVEQLDHALAQLEAWKNSAREMPALPTLSAPEMAPEDPLLIRAHGGTRSSRLPVGELRDWILQQWQLPPVALTADKVLDLQTDRSHLLRADASAEPLTVTLPAVTKAADHGAVLMVQKVDNSTNSVLFPDLSFSLDRPGQWVLLVADMAGWSFLEGGPVREKGLPQGYLNGLNLSNHQDYGIIVGQGQAAPDFGSGTIDLTTMLTKQLDLAFETGHGKGGFAAGETLPTSGTVHIWAITDTKGMADIFANDHAVSGLHPNLPEGYVAKRRIGSIVTDAGALRPFHQIGTDRHRKIDFRPHVRDLAFFSLGTTITDIAISVPTGLKVKADVSVGFATSPAAFAWAVKVYDPDEGHYNATTDYTVFNAIPNIYETTGVITGDQRRIDVMTDPMSQIRIDATNSGNIDVITLGYTDFL